MEYEFTLKFAMEGQDVGAMLNRLYEAGCDDAIVGTGQSSCIALNFTRQAVSAEAAISSAISNVKSAIPSATLI